MNARFIAKWFFIGAIVVAVLSATGIAAFAQEQSRAEGIARMCLSAAVVSLDASESAKQKSFERMQGQVGDVFVKGMAAGIRAGMSYDEAAKAGIFFYPASDDRMKECYDMYRILLDEEQGN